MQAKADVVGVVIAGGRSVRFGGEKAVAQFGGRAMLLWAVDRLMRACSHVAVNARPGTECAALAQAQGLTLLHDRVGDPDGPLSGVRAGLEWALGRGVGSLAVSPCDAPLLPADLYVRLAATAGSGAAMAETAEGRQPMCAVWPTQALSALNETLIAGAHPPTWRVLEQLGAVKLRVDPPELFANVNTREDLARLEAAFYQR